MRGNPALIEEVIPGIEPHSLNTQLIPKAKTLTAPHHVHSPKKAPHPFAFRTRTQLRPTPASPFENSESETFVLEQRLSLADMWRHHRNFGGSQLECKTVFFVDCVHRPAIRPVELHDDWRSAFESDLVDAVFVTVEREDATIRNTAQRFDTFNDDVWG